MARRRGFRWVLLGFTCLWFGALVPVHQRGQIQLPGSAAAAAHCHPADAAHRHCHDQPADNDSEQSRRDNCAVCHFIATLDVPAPPAVGLSPLGYLTLVAPPAPADAAVAPIALPFHSRAPPVA